MAPTSKMSIVGDGEMKGNIGRGFGALRGSVAAGLSQLQVPLLGAPIGLLGRAPLSCDTRHLLE